MPNLISIDGRDTEHALEWVEDNCHHAIEMTATWRHEPLAHRRFDGKAWNDRGALTSCGRKLASPWARSGFTFDNDNDAVLFKLRWG